jgi:predicted lipoprotein with Yx(FWY)xxD motif
MTRRRPSRFLSAVAAVPLLALAVAACGGGSTATVSSSPAKTSSGHTATVGMATNASLGKILVDSQGRTLYLFQADNGTKSSCTGACAVDWPPLRASGKPVAGSGISASKLGTSARSDGTPQVTYNGHPLYRFENDQKPGDANGQGLNAFGGAWYVLSPAGTAITGSGSSSGGGSNSY